MPPSGAARATRSCPLGSRSPRRLLDYDEPVVGWIVLAVVVILLGGAFLLDRTDRRHGRRRRDSSEMLSNRRERERNFRSTPEHGVPLMDDWDKPPDR